MSSSKFSPCTLKGKTNYSLALALADVNSGKTIIDDAIMCLGLDDLARVFKKLDPKSGILSTSSRREIVSVASSILVRFSPEVKKRVLQECLEKLKTSPQTSPRMTPYSKPIAPPVFRPCSATKGRSNYTLQTAYEAALTHPEQIDDVIACLTAVDLYKYLVTLARQINATEIVSMLTKPKAERRPNMLEISSAVSKKADYRQKLAPLQELALGKEGLTAVESTTVAPTTVAAPSRSNSSFPRAFLDVEHAPPTKAQLQAIGNEFLEQIGEITGVTHGNGQTMFVGTHGNKVAMLINFSPKNNWLFVRSGDGKFTEGERYPDADATARDLVNQNYDRHSVEADVIARVIENVYPYAPPFLPVGMNGPDPKKVVPFFINKIAPVSLKSAPVSAARTYEQPIVSAARTLKQPTASVASASAVILNRTFKNPVTVSAAAVSSPARALSSVGLTSAPAAIAKEFLDVIYASGKDTPNTRNLFGEVEESETRPRTLFVGIKGDDVAVLMKFGARISKYTKIGSGEITKTNYVDASSNELAVKLVSEGFERHSIQADAIATIIEKDGTPKGNYKSPFTEGVRAPEVGDPEPSSGPASRIMAAESSDSESSDVPLVRRPQTAAMKTQYVGPQASKNRVNFDGKTIYDIVIKDENNGTEVMQNHGKNMSWYTGKFEANERVFIQPHVDGPKFMAEINEVVKPRDNLWLNHGGYKLKFSEKLKYILTNIDDDLYPEEIITRRDDERDYNTLEFSDAKLREYNGLYGDQGMLGNDGMQVDQVTDQSDSNAESDDEEHDYIVEDVNPVYRVSDTNIESIVKQITSKSDDYNVNAVGYCCLDKPENGNKIWILFTHKTKNEYSVMFGVATSDKLQFRALTSNKPSNTLASNLIRDKRKEGYVFDDYKPTGKILERVRK